MNNLVARCRLSGANERLGSAFATGYHPFFAAPRGNIILSEHCARLISCIDAARPDYTFASAMLSLTPAELWKRDAPRRESLISANISPRMKREGDRNKKKESAQERARGGMGGRGARAHSARDSHGALRFQREIKNQSTRSSAGTIRTGSISIDKYLVKTNVTPLARIDAVFRAVPFPKNLGKNWIAVRRQ